MAKNFIKWCLVGCNGGATSRSRVVLVVLPLVFALGLFLDALCDSVVASLDVEWDLEEASESWVSL